jgi:hypothetical protein
VEGRERSLSFDVTAELTIPAALEDTHGPKVAIAKAIVFLLRLSINPATTVPALSKDLSFTPLLHLHESSLIKVKVCRWHGWLKNGNAA